LNRPATLENELWHVSASTKALLFAPRDERFPVLGTLYKWSSRKHPNRLVRDNSPGINNE